jgi:hypothetical protein
LSGSMLRTHAAGLSRTDPWLPQPQTSRVRSTARQKAARRRAGRPRRRRIFNPVDDPFCQGGNGCVVYVLNPRRWLHPLHMYTGNRARPEEPVCCRRDPCQVHLLGSAAAVLPPTSTASAALRSPRLPVPACSCRCSLPRAQLPKLLPTRRRRSRWSEHALRVGRDVHSAHSTSPFSYYDDGSREWISRCQTWKKSSAPFTKAKSTSRFHGYGITGSM